MVCHLAIPVSLDRSRTEDGELATSFEIYPCCRHILCFVFMSVFWTDLEPLDKRETEQKTEQTEARDQQRPHTGTDSMVVNPTVSPATAAAQGRIGCG